MTVEQQLNEVKATLEKVLDRLDALVVLEVQHTNTVEGLGRAHRRLDRMDVQIQELAREAAANTFLTKVGERAAWIIISSGVGLAAYLLR